MPRDQVTVLERPEVAPEARPGTTGGGAVVKRHALPADGRPVTVGRGAVDIDLDNPGSPAATRSSSASGRGTSSAISAATAPSSTASASPARRYPRRGGAGRAVQAGLRRASLSQYDQRGALRIDARRLSQRVRGGRYILRDVSLSIAPREFVALVGGSGAGKSTLMKALAGYAAASHGQVLVNGEDFYAHLDVYRALLGYVPQDDTLHRELPVDGALAYTARLRLPADTGGGEIDARIARVLEDVDMAATGTSASTSSPAGSASG